MFDEPLSNLDAKLRVQMRTEIRALHQRLKTTSVYVTHDQIEAMTMADRIIVLRDGKVEQIGTPAALYDSPCNSFVATFIGSPAMNIVAAKADGMNAIADFGGQIQLPDGFAGQGSQRMLLGLRPEHLQVRPAGEDHGIPCEVRVVEFSGADTLLTCAAQGQPVQALVHDRLLVKPGDNITLAIDPARVHVFDETTQRRLAG